MNTPLALPNVSKPQKSLAIRLSTISRSLVLLSIFATVCACYYAKEILAPLLIAVLLSLLISSAVSMLERLKLPRVAASALAVFALVVIVLVGIMALTEPARDWAAKAPQSLHSIQQKLATWRGPIQDAQKAGESIEEMTKPAQAATQQVVLKDPPYFSGIVSGTPGVLASIASVILLLFFFLSSGDNFLRRLVEIAPNLTEKRTVVSVAREIQREISRYLLTITYINFGLGCATALAMMFLQVPNAILWGALVFLLNFAPYVGATVMVVTLALVGLATFDGLGHALAIPGTFLLLAFGEGQLVTPFVIGRRLALNPVIVFVWLLIWGLLWGLIGLFLAGPLLACFRIICQHTEALRPVYILIGEAKFDDSATG